MVAFFVVLQLLVAVFLILIVLLQPGNRGGMSSAFGAGGGDSAFGGRGANTFLAKFTFGAAVVFMVTNVVLSVLSTPKSSVVDRIKLPAATATPEPVKVPQPPAAPEPKK